MTAKGRILYQQIHGGNKKDPVLKAKVRRAHADMRRFLVEEYMKEGDVGAEVGVDWGEFAEVVVEIAKPLKYYLIDPWSSDPEEYPQRVGGYENVLSVFDEEIRQGRVVVMKMTGLQGAEEILDESLDWVYIDCSHRYQDVIDNLSSFLPKVKQGGYIMGDDYQNRGVNRGFSEFIQANNVKVVLEDFEIDNQVVLQKL